MTWTIRRRAYPLLALRFLVLYIQSRRFRSIVRLSYRQRHLINGRVALNSLKAYLLVTNSRITLAGRVL